MTTIKKFYYFIFALLTSMQLVSCSSSTSSTSTPPIFAKNKYEYEINTKYKLDYNLNYGIRKLEIDDYDISLLNNSANAQIEWVSDSRWDFRSYIFATKPGSTDLVVSYKGSSSEVIHFAFDSSNKYTVTFYDIDGNLIQTTTTYDESIDVPKETNAISVPKLDYNNFIGWSDGDGIYEFGEKMCAKKSASYYPICGDDQGTDGLVYEEKEDYYIVSGYKGVEYDVVIPAIYNDKYVTEVKNGAFANKAIESIKFPQTMRSIGSSAFEGANLKQVYFEHNNILKTIGAYAFKNCSSLETILIPKAVTTIGIYTFDECENLIILFESENGKSISFGSSWDGSSYLGGGGRPYYFGVKEVITCDDYRYAKLKSDKILLLKYFGTKVFNETSIDGLRILWYADSCFYNSSLEEILISSEATYIGNYCFYNCSNLKKIYFENSNSRLNTIGAYAFKKCSSLKTIFIPKSVTTIGSYAFDECGNLIILFESENGKSISFGSSWDGSSYLGGGGRPYYYDISGDSKIDATGQFEYVEYNDGKIGILKYIPKKDYDVVSIDTIDGKKVKAILLYAFANSKISKVICGSELENIRGHAFENCEYLEEIDTTKSKKLTNIYAYAFSGCKRLEYFFIPNCVEQINSYAFKGCTNLTILFNSLDKSEITLESNYNPEGQREIFNVKSVDEKYINVNGSLKYYISNRNEVGIISYKGNVTTTDLLDNKYRNGPNTDMDFTNIDGMPVIEICDYAFSGLSANVDGPSVITFTFGKNIKRIGYCAFYNLFNGDARSFKIVFESESQLESIGSYAFCGHYASGVIVPKSVNTIGKCAFGLSTWLNSSTIYMEKNDKSNMSLGSYWNGNQTVYWGNDWEYVNGVPTLK